MQKPAMACFRQTRGSTSGQTRGSRWIGATAAEAAAAAHRHLTSFSVTPAIAELSAGRCVCVYVSMGVLHPKANTTTHTHPVRSSQSSSSPHTPSSSTSFSRSCGHESTSPHTSSPSASLSESRGHWSTRWPTQPGSARHEHGHAAHTPSSTQRPSDEPYQKKNRTKGRGGRTEHNRTEHAYMDNKNWVAEHCRAA
jgi:hypothetical protein